MSDRYSGHGSAATGTNKTILTAFCVSATPKVRPRLYELLLGSVATPADVAALFYLSRLTAVGTEGSGFTPVALDPAAPTGECDCGVGVFSVEPTYTASKELLAIPMNQRATFRWIAAPGGELVLPATQNNGVGLKSSSMSSGTPAFDVTMHWME